MADTGWEDVEYFDAREIIPAVFPGARVTSTSRSSSDPLSRKNPKSRHIDNPNAYDVAPIKGVTHDQFIQGLRAAGYEVRGARDEVKNPSGWATGPHWHGEIVKGPPNGGWEDVTPEQVAPPAQQTVARPIVPDDPLAGVMATGDPNDPLTRALTAEQSAPGYDPASNDAVAGSNLGPAPEGNWGQRIMNALTEGVLPPEYANLPIGNQIDAVLRLIGAGTEAIRGTPLEGLALAFPMGLPELGAVRGGIAAVRGKPLPGGVLDEGLVGTVTDESPVQIPYTPEELAQISKVDTRAPAGGKLGVNDNVPPEPSPPPEIDYDALANEAQKSGDPNADLYWMSKAIKDSGNHRVFTMDQLEDVMDDLDISIQENPDNPLLQGIMDNLEEVWTEKRAEMSREEGSSLPTPANTDTRIPAEKLTDDPLEQNLINLEDRASDLGFNDPRRFADRRTKAYKEWNAEVTRAEEARDAARVEWENSKQSKLGTEETLEPMDPSSTEPGKEVTTYTTDELQQLLAQREAESAALRESEPALPLSGGGAKEPPKPPVGGEPPSGPTPPDTPVGRLASALTDARKAWTEQEAARTKERAARIAEARKIGKLTEGQEGFHAEKSALKGEMPTTKLPNISDFFSQEDLSGLFDQIKNHKGFDFYKTLNAREGLERILQGDLPRPSEMKLLQEVFDPQSLKTIIDNRDILGQTFRKGQRELFPQGETLSTGPIRYLSPEPKPIDPEKFVDDPLQGDFFKDKPRFSKGGGPGGGKPPQQPINSKLDIVYDILGLPFSLMSSFDLSAFRQAGFLVSRPEFWKAAPTMIKSLGNEKNYNALMSEIKSRPSYKRMEEAGVSFSDIGNKLTSREETMVSRLAEKIPGIRASNRAYSGYLNKVRADVFDSILRDFERAGVDFNEEANAKWLKQLGRYINNATGRGELGKLSKYGPAMNVTLFSPRLQASRVNLLLKPFKFMLEPFGIGEKTHPVIRKNYFRDLAGFSSAVVGILSLAKLAGADVELDPRSSDFAKIKDGNTRHDVMVGFQQYIRLGAQLASGQTKTLKGDIRELGEGFGRETALDKIITFIRSKGSPVATFVADYFDGKNVVGEPFELQKALVSRLTPFSFQTLAEAYEDRGMEGLVKALDTLIGSGVQTFDSTKPRSAQKAPTSSEPTTVEEVTEEPISEDEGEWETVQ